MKQREIKFRIWTGRRMEYKIMAGFLGAFYVQGMDDKDTACTSTLNTKYTDEAPLMQYTGLKDKNGMEIYEGDIIKLKTNYHARDKKFGWQNIEIFFEELSYKGRNTDGHIYDLIEETDEGTYAWEVIGNIYEHPNLLCAQSAA